MITNAAEKWQMRDVKVDSGIDFFTPVLSKIYKDLFRSKNSQKYVIGYFECSVDNIAHTLSFYRKVVSLMLFFYESV